VGLAAAHAVLFACSFPSLSLWPLMLAAPVPLIWLAVGAASTRRALLAVFIAQLLMWLWIQRWIIAVTAAGWPALAIYMTLYGVLFVWLVRRVGQHPVMGRWPLTITAPVLWVGIECLRGNLLFHGYPWFFAGHPLIEWPLLAQSADLLGVFGLSFLVVMTGAVLIDRLRLRAGSISRRALVVVAAVTVGLHVANGLYGAWRLRQDAPISPGPTVLAIQTNLPQDNKIGWPLSRQREDLDGFVEQTEQAFEDAGRAGAQPDLVIWPETMLPGFGMEPQIIQTLLDVGFVESASFPLGVVQLTERLGVPLLVGSPCFVGLRAGALRWEWDAHYNSAYLIDGDPPYQRYDKVFLTPFGETMPYISAWPWLEERFLALGAPGMSFDLDTPAGITRLGLDRRSTGSAPAAPVTLATPICFEDTVARVCRRMIHDEGRKVVDLLVSLSNDGWFGDHDAGREQHAQAARFRCIENRVPMVRAVNTGMTVAVDSAGRLIGRAGPGRYGNARSSEGLWAELPLDSRCTVYGRVGDLWGWVCLAVTGGLGVWATVGRRRG
jgi:apolipoprotein N-acyltransferase